MTLSTNACYRLSRNWVISNKLRVSTRNGKSVSGTQDSRVPNILLAFYVKKKMIQKAESFHARTLKAGIGASGLGISERGEDGQGTGLPEESLFVFGEMAA